MKIWAARASGWLASSILNADRNLQLGGQRRATCELTLCSEIVCLVAHYELESNITGLVIDH